MEKLSSSDRKRNFTAFIIHAIFLALTMSFIDINTVVPNMIGEAGGTSVHLGILSAIMIGGTSFMQIFFAGFLLPHSRKKPFLIAGIYLRVSALIVLGLFLLKVDSSSSQWMVFLILGIMAIFSFSGSFASISYMDILGRVIAPEQRKKFFMFKQLVSSIGVIASALMVKLILSRSTYPKNYTILFVSAGILLLAGTVGFWMIREPESDKKKMIPMKVRFKAFKEALVEDRNLRFYLMIINTSGVALSTIPFLILFGRNQFEITGSRVGTFLLVQMGGSLAVNILLNLFHKRERYKGLLYAFIAAGSATPLLALLFKESSVLYILVFLVSGAALALYQVAQPGVLIEISNEENRPVYTGLSGAGSIMNIVYPVAAGFLVQVIGFPAVLIMTSLYILIGLYPVTKIVCLRLAGEP